MPWRIFSESVLDLLLEQCRHGNTPHRLFEQEDNNGRCAHNYHSLVACSFNRPPKPTVKGEKGDSYAERCQKNSKISSFKHFRVQLLGFDTAIQQLRQKWRSASVHRRKMKYICIDFDELVTESFLFSIFSWQNNNKDNNNNATAKCLTIFWLIYFVTDGKLNVL